MKTFSNQIWVWLARFLMLITLVFMAWSIARGLGQDAFYQFILGTSVVLILRRWRESKDTNKDAPNG